MKGAGVIGVERYTFKTAQAYDDYIKWANASLTPMLMSSDNLLGIESSFPLEDKLTFISINHFQYLENYFAYLRSQERNAYEKDVRNTWGGKWERSWRSLYLVVRRFNVMQRDPINKGDIVDKDTYLKQFDVDGAPVIILKGLALSPDEWVNYEAWMREWGYDIYLPMLLKAPGIIEYCRCWLSNINRKGAGSAPEPSYTINEDFPQDLSLIYFENMKASQNFLNSKEQAAYGKTLTAAFPGGFNYKWDTAFRLARRFSK